MRIGNQIKIKPPLMPDKLIGHITIISTCPLEEKEFNATQVSLFLLSDFQNIYPFSKSAHCNIIYTLSNIIEIIEDNQAILGAAPHLAIYNLEHIRQRGTLTWLDLVPIILEELCHSLYQIQNEYEVKELVCKIVNQKYKMSLHQTYPSLFDENNNRLKVQGHPEEWLMK